jgi:hypothetical protein
VGDYQKEMAFQVGSQGNVHLLFNILFSEDIRDLKFDLIYFMLLNLIYKFASIWLLNPRYDKCLHVMLVIIDTVSCDLTFSDWFVRVVFHSNDIIIVILSISINFNVSQLRYHIVDDHFFLFLDKDVMKLILEDVL